MPSFLPFLKSSALAAILPIFAIAAPPLSAQENNANEKSSEQEYFCPNGSYGYDCTKDDIKAAIKPEKNSHIPLSMRCLYESKNHCHPLAFGEITGMEKGNPILWQKMAIWNDGSPAGEMIVLIDKLDADNPVIGFAQHIGYSDAPHMVVNDDDGIWVHIPINIGGRSVGNGDMLLFNDGDGWHDIDMESWKDEANALMPHGFTLGYTIFYNLHDGFASVPVRRDDDGACCASGGNAFVDLELNKAERKLQLSMLSFQQTENSGDTQILK